MTVVKDLKECGIIKNAANVIEETTLTAQETAETAP
jgi:hypothetical protein